MGQGFPVKCGTNQAQILADATREVRETSEEWLGKGLLIDADLVAAGELRLPVVVAEVVRLRQKKAVARRAVDDPMEHSGSHGKKADMQLQAAGPYDIGFVPPFGSSSECHRVQVVVEDSRINSLGEEFQRQLSKYGAERATIKVTVSVEVASCSIRGKYSPFQSERNVEEGVKRELEKSRGSADLARFAENYGNCIVEKVFCGGVLTSKFRKVQPGSAEQPGPFVISIGQEHFCFSSPQNRGGRNVFKKDPAAIRTCQDFEKEINSWVKQIHSFDPSIKQEVVRLKLAPFAKVEGVNVPTELNRMDFARLEKWQKASEALRQATKTKKLDDLRAAVGLADACDLEDDALPAMQDTLKALDAALEVLKAACEHKSIAELQNSLEQCRVAELNLWDAPRYDEGKEMLKNLETEYHDRRMVAAAGNEDVRLEDLVDILLEAYNAGYSELPSFQRVTSRLETKASELSQQAKEDLLTSDNAERYRELLQRIPQAAIFANINLAASSYAQSVADMEVRIKDKKAREEKKLSLEVALRDALQRAQAALSTKSEQWSEETFLKVEELVSEVDTLLGIQLGGSDLGSTDGDSVAGEDITIRELRREAQKVRQRKRDMDEAAENVERQLRQAMQQSSPSDLEVALQELEVKRQSGQLPPVAPSRQLGDSAKRQLLVLLLPEAKEQLERAEAPGAAHSDGPEALATVRQLLRRLETCRGVSEGELERVEERFHELQADHGKQKDRYAAQNEAREKLQHCLDSGDPEFIADALQQAQACGVPEGQMCEARSRMHQLEIAERQLQSSLKSGDRVHLSTALEEASRARLKTISVDEARHQLQSSKTSRLVSAIKQSDYFALQRAIDEAESRDDAEVEDVRDVLAQAKQEYARLDTVALSVSEALGSLNYYDLQRNVSEAKQLGVFTDDVKRAENVLGAMNQALELLQAAAGAQPRDLAALQEALHTSRQQGLQDHPDYNEGEEIFAEACLPPQMVWALEEQRQMWVVLCLRRPLQGSGRELRSITHPFTVAVAELCHAAQLSAEVEPYAVQFVHHALARVAGVKELAPSDQKNMPDGRTSSTIASAVGAHFDGKLPSELHRALLAALQDFSRDPCDGPPGAGEAHTKASVDAHRFNAVGVAAKKVGLEKTSHFLWWLVCIVEWETEQRLLSCFMMEQSRRTVDLLTEAESTERTLRTQATALQAKRSDEDTDLAPPSGIATLSAAASESRLTAVRGVLDEIEQLKKEAEKLQAKMEKEGGIGTSGQSQESDPDLGRILELLKQAHPQRLHDARSAVQLRQKEASGRARDIFAAQYTQLETRLLQLHYKGRQALDGEDFNIPVNNPRTLGTPGKDNSSLAAVSLPLYSLSSSVEAASSLQDHAFLQLLGIPEGNRSASQSIDRCFQRIEVYERFGAAKGAVEEEFEVLCREAVAEARQRCGGRRLIAALKPLMVDLMKRRQKISALLNTLSHCGLDQVEKNMLRKHLQPRDLLIALAFSSMQPGPSQARMMSLCAKTDSPIPFLFGWAQPQTTNASGVGVLQLCVQIHWGALRELFCSPSHPLVLSLGTSHALGKSRLLEYLYALQEVHFRGSAKNPLRIHSMPSIDIIGDFARESPLRGVVLADVHTYDPREELCDSLVATLANCAALMILHVSVKEDFVKGNEAFPRMSDDLEALIKVLCVGGGCTSILLLLRDVDTDDYGPQEKRRLNACIQAVKDALSASSSAPGVLSWTVPPLGNLAPTELASEVKSLRKSRDLDGSRVLEEVLSSVVGSSRKFPSIPVLQQRFDAFASALREHCPSPHLSRDREGSPIRTKSLDMGPLTAVRLPQEVESSYGPLAQRMFRELEGASTHENLLHVLFPISICHQRLTALSQDKVRCLNRGRDYLEPEERKRLESKTDELDREINRLRDERRQTPPHALLRTFAQLVLTGDLDKIAEFGAYLDDWKQQRRAPLLETKLRWRKELDSLLESKEEQEASMGAGKKQVQEIEPNRIAKLRNELTSLQRKLDEIDASTDTFWLELMLWYEMERIGVRRGLREIDERLSFGACKAAYLTWVKNGNPIHFLHSSPLQFGAFDPLRWHPQISGASLFGSDFIGDILRELDRDLGVDVRRRPLLVISVIGVQSSGKSTLMNYLFGCSFATHVGRCTKGLYISLLETKRELVVILDTEGLLSVEARDDVFDKQVALMTMACSDLVIVNNRGELGRHVGDLFQVCLFALYHLKLARISPAIGFVLQCLSMVNQQQQYEWVATVKKSLEESVQELQQKEKPNSFKLQDLVFLDSESIFVMPSAFNDDVQFGLQVSRPTNLYAMKALQLREQVFHWIANAKAMQKQRVRELDGSGPSVDTMSLQSLQEATSTSSFASLSQWYEHARTVWQTLSMCGTDLLQFRTMRQVLMAQQLQEFCDALVQKHVDAKLNKESEALIERYAKELREASSTQDVHVIDNEFRGNLDALRDAVLQEMQHEFDEFVKAHDAKFTDEQVKSDKRYSLMGPMRRKYASVDSQWRSAVHLALERNSMDQLFEEITVRVNELLSEQGQNINVSNVEKVFNEKWNQVMAETQKKNRPNLEKVKNEVLLHFNAALSNWKSQFRKSHVFHGVKTLSVSDVGTENEIRASFLVSKKGVGDKLVHNIQDRQMLQSARTQVDNLWIKVVDSMRLEIDQRGQMSDATALKILNRLNAEIESGDHLRQLMHQLGSKFVQNIFVEIAKATMHYRYQIEQANFEARMNEILGKKQQKLWEIQARVDTGKREVHCAKVWAKNFVDNLDNHFRNAVGTMATQIVSHISSILTNPANACELAIERSFTKRNWRHVVMYAIDPTQYLFMEFHREWDSFKQGLVNQYCQELKNSFGRCLGIVDGEMQSLFESGAFDDVQDLTMTKLSDRIRKSCEQMVDESLVNVLCNCLPTFPKETDYKLNDLKTFEQFVGLEMSKYRNSTTTTRHNVERRMEQELQRQKSSCWKSLCGCPARCPGCGTKCNLESENHWPERAHECRRHLYPAFNGWQKQEGRKPFLLHCRARAQWQIARTRPPLEPYGKERYWDNFQEMLEDEHPDWLDPVSRKPMPSMEPLEDFEEDAPDAPEAVQREIEENRRAWANCKDALLEHFTSMADDLSLDWLDRFKREGGVSGALKASDFPSIRDELFEITPLEALEFMDNTLQVDELDQAY